MRSPLLKSGGTAAVLWRSGTAAPDAHRIRLHLLWRDQLLNSHLVFPTIGKVVLVQKAFIHTKVEIAQPEVASIPRVSGTAQPRNPIFLAANAEAMKVVIGPGECDLDGVVEVSEGAR